MGEEEGERRRERERGRQTRELVLVRESRSAGLLDFTGGRSWRERNTYVESLVRLSLFTLYPERWLREILWLVPAQCVVHFR